MAKFKRLLITGAAGALGKVLREGVADLAENIRLNDVEDMGTAAGHEEIVQAPLEDMDTVMAMCADVDAVLHFGGQSIEGKWKQVLNSNIIGGYNIYEASRKQGVKRVIFASSNHSIGFYPRTQRIDDGVPHKPDSLYGVSKAFTEDLASLYWDKFKLETVSLRIGSCFPEPVDRRMMATWMSYKDFTQMVRRSLTTPYVGFHVVYGTSNNREQFWDNSSAQLIGFQPEDSAEQFREKVEAKTQPQAVDDPALVYCGGGFPAYPHPDDT